MFQSATTLQTANVNRYSNLWKLICFLTPISTFLVLIIRYNQNIPATDDFGATLQFIYKFFYTNLSVKQQVQSLFEQHNEHRILVSRLLALILYKLTDELNLVYFTYLDTTVLAGLLITVVTVYRSIMPTIRWYHYLVPFLLLLSPHSYETFLFISGGSQSYAVLFFTTVSLWLLYKVTLKPNSERINVFYISLLAAWLATFSFGSGFLVWLGGSVFLYYKRQWRKLLIWILAGLLSTGYYFYQYYRPDNKLAMTGLSDTQLIAFLKGIILFPGAAFMVHWPNFNAIQLQVIVCYAIGIISWCYILYLIVINYSRRNPLLFSLLIVSLCVGFILSISRIGVGSGFLFTSRYLVFTSFTPVILYAIALDQRVNLFYNKVWASILAFLLFISSLWTNLPFMEQIYSDRQKGFGEWQRTGKPTLYIDANKQAEADHILRQCIDKRIFRPADSQYTSVLP